MIEKDVFVLKPLDELNQNELSEATFFKQSILDKSDAEFWVAGGAIRKFFNKKFTLIFNLLFKIEVWSYISVIIYLILKFYKFI